MDASLDEGQPLMPTDQDEHRFERKLGDDVYRLVITTARNGRKTWELQFLDRWRDPPGWRLLPTKATRLVDTVRLLFAPEAKNYALYTTTRNAEIDSAPRDVWDFGIDVDAAVTDLKAMAHPDRLHILLLLRKSDMEVGELASALGRPSATVSQNLKILLTAGLVTYRRSGTHITYSLISDRARTMLGTLDVKYMVD